MNETALKWLLISPAAIIFIVFAWINSGGCEPQSPDNKTEQELSFTVCNYIWDRALIPDSVEFGKFNIQKKDDGYEVRGSFETKNAFGTMIPQNFKAVFDENKRLIQFIY